RILVAGRAAVAHVGAAVTARCAAVLTWVVAARVGEIAARRRALARRREREAEREEEKRLVTEHRRPPSGSNRAACARRGTRSCSWPSRRTRACRTPLAPMDAAFGRAAASSNP